MVLDEPYLYVKGGENVPYMTEYGLRYAPYATLTAFDTRTGTRVWNYTLNRERGASWAYEGILSSDGTGTKTIYLISHEGYPLPEPVGPEQIVSDTEYLVYGFSSSSAQDVPEFPITLITLAISVSIIPLVFRKRKSGRMIGQ